jgi:hypothetical protein
LNNKEYLEFIRQKNKEVFSKCYYCDGFAITIIADGYAIKPVCKNHDDRTLDEIGDDIE